MDWWIFKAVFLTAPLLLPSKSSQAGRQQCDAGGFSPWWGTLRKAAVGLPSRVQSFPLTYNFSMMHCAFWQAQAEYLQPERRNGARYTLSMVKFLEQSSKWWLRCEERNKRKEGDTQGTVLSTVAWCTTSSWRLWTCTNSIIWEVLVRGI